MCLSEKINKIAIFGPSCSGKSSIAIELGKLLEFTVRHCGELIKNRAKTLDVSLSQLSIEEHKLIDGETRQIASDENEKTVIDGMFLNHVLSGMENVIFIELTCQEEVRGQRFVKRENSVQGGLKTRDKEMAEFRQKLFGNIQEQLHRKVAFDTSDSKTPYECAEKILKIICEKFGD